MSKPVVAILMGSQSDKDVMKKASDVLNEFGVEHTFHVMSAHRLPDQVADFASHAEERGYKVLIGGAGMAAHLCGALAAHSTLPVIGVPLTSQIGLGGLDSLLSTVQMPKGVPVATVAVDGSANAAYIAVQILALSDAGINAKYKAFKAGQRDKLLSEMAS